MGQVTLDYDVPESPAFVALDATPERVLRGSAAKPMVASVINQLTSGTLGAGVAVDVVPYSVYGGRLRSAREYQNNRIKYWLTNLSVSFAAIDTPGGAEATAFGIGARLAVWDSKDLLLDTRFIEEIDQALSAAADADIEPGDDEVVDLEVSTLDRGVDMAPIYDAARRRQPEKRGGSLALGWAYAGTLQGRVLASDSLSMERHNAWAAYQYTVGRGVDFLATGRAVFSSDDRVPSTGQIGVAARANSAGTNFSAEFVYDFDQDRLNPGVSASIRVLKGLRLIGSVVSQPLGPGSSERTIKLFTNVQWNMSELGR